MITQNAPAGTAVTNEAPAGIVGPVKLWHERPWTVPEVTP